MMAQQQLHNGLTVGDDCQQSSVPVIDSFLGCSLCQQRYTEPKLLPCLHTFCRQCLDANTPPHSLSVMCPTCRQQSIVPPEGVSGLQDSGFVLRLLDFVDCRQKCKDCIESSSGVCATHSSVVEEELTTVPLVCRSHNSEMLTELCHDCETVFCGRCSEHAEHRTERLTDEAVFKQREELTELLQTISKPAAEVQHSLKCVADVGRALGDNHVHTRQTVGQIFDSLVAVIERRRQAILSEIDNAFEIKNTVLQQQVERLSHLLVSMTACCQFTRQSVDVPHSGMQQVMIARKELSDRLTSLNPMPSMPPAENDCLKFLVTQQELDTLERLVGELGDIATGGATAVETTAAGDGLKECWPNQPSTVIVTPRDHNGKVVKIGHSALSATITPAGKNSNKTVSSCQLAFIKDITCSGDGSYELTYIIHQPGTFLLDIFLNSHPIRGSPFRLRAHREVKGSVESLQRMRSDGRVKSSSTASGGGSSHGGSGSVSLKRPSSSQSHGSQQQISAVDDDLVLRIGSQGRNKGQFMNPQGVAFCQLTSSSNSDLPPVVHRRVLVADSNNQCVQVFSATSGECLLRFGTRGRLASQLQRPTGVAVTTNGNYLVSDYDNKWVGVFSPEGKYINRIGSGKLLGPKGVCCDGHGRIIVIDNRGSAVYIFQSNGRIIQKFGSRGASDPRHLAGPHFCAVTPCGRDVVITDFHNHRVKVFDIDSGSLKFTFGSAGEGNGQFGAPTGVAVDKQGNILVADWGNSRIQVFDSEGSFLSFVNTSADPLYGPQGLAVTDDGYIIVADSGNHCFKIYKHLLH